MVTRRGEIAAEEVVPTQAGEGASAVLERIKESVYRVCGLAGLHPEETLGLGLGSPGPLDLEQGVVIFSPNLGWKDVPIRKEMEQTFHLRVVMDNDARAAAWGEFLHGAGQGCRNMVYITLSTGIGGGLILDGRLYRGSHGNAGEVGHMTVASGGPLCGCGNRGCWEALASGTAIAKRAREGIEAGGTSSLAMHPGLDSISAKEVARAAREGDALAAEVLEEAFCSAGLGVANLVNIFDPDRIILGGGLVNVGEPLLDSVRRGIKERVLPGPGRNTVVLPAALGDRAGVIGAASLILASQE